MKRILFVCHGNICRSPMAEFTMRHLVEEAHRGDTIVVDSAAVSREEIGNPIYPHAARELARHGITCHHHEARQMAAADYDRYDLIVGMDKSNMQRMRAIVGDDTEHKLSLLMEHCGQHRDVADPWYTRDFGAAWDDIYAGCKALLDELTHND